ncbi:CDP-glycerol glycerophosphotransferase family protein [Shewanella sp. UCD-KL12]|uniref:CDP-glycerol glycerophosphotransferase family protein n=1 Tax=Shewanella sp. UCD-KL12 TaxID=1917163 RepID=UPI0009706997|nr:CDP-glycerol glycerophosphotransferase family protein [Shewanella sp. UCD-KL12]
MFYFILLGLRKVIYHCSAFSPRVKKAVMGSYKNQFSDNAKYLYLHWQQTHFIRAIWISGDPQLVSALKKRGFEAYHRRSLLGLFHCLTAKFYFYNSYIGDINQYLAKGAVKVNLWHGSPLKKIEFDIESGPLSNTYKTDSWSENLKCSLKFHQQYIKPDLMLSPSPLMDQLFSSAFRLQASALYRSGNPRTDYYRRYPTQRTSIQKMMKHKFSKVIVYAPTWSDTLAYAEGKEVNRYEQAFDWEMLSQHLQVNNQLFLIRLHPNEAHLAGKFDQYSNILDISHWQDIYSTMHEIDLLITDQSSLCIDFLTYQTPTLFYVPEQATASVADDITEAQGENKQNIQSQREMYDYVDALPIFGNDSSAKVFSFEALLMKLEESDSFYVSAKHSEQYKQLSNLFWSEGDNDCHYSDAFEVIEKQINHLSGNTDIGELPQHSAVKSHIP